jgi:hypothetical protein
MCYNPVKIYDHKTGEFIKTVSCRKCIECQQVRANEWGVRCHFELKEHNENCFLTLTYDEMNNPGVLVKDDLQRFIKRLRKDIAPAKIKYFAGGEYGSQRLRPHFHIIIFGYDFNDKMFVKLSSSGKPIYQSNQLDKIWKLGMATVQEANIDTVRYTAKYASKRGIMKLPDYLEDYPEYNVMSKNMGLQAMLDKMGTFIKTNEIWIDGFSYQIPNYILTKYVNQFTDLSIGEKTDLFNDLRNYDQWKIVQNSKLRDRERITKKKLLHSKLTNL